MEVLYMTIFKKPEKKNLFLPLDIQFFAEGGEGTGAGSGTKDLDLKTLQKDFSV